MRPIAAELIGSVIKKFKNQMRLQRLRMALAMMKTSCCAVAMLSENKKWTMNERIGIAASYNPPGDECEKIKIGSIRVKAAEEWIDEVPSISQLIDC